MSTQETQNTDFASSETSISESAPKTALWPEIGLAAHLAVVAVLGAIIMVTFANTLHNTGFALDNKFIILEDPRLRDNKPDNIKQIFQQDYWWPKAVSGLYRPLTTFSYMVNYTVFGDKDNATGYHWMNLLIHWANAVLVYLAILVLMEKLWPAIFGAILFATTRSLPNLSRISSAALICSPRCPCCWASSCMPEAGWFREEKDDISWPTVGGLAARQSFTGWISAFVHRSHECDCCRRLFQTNLPGWSSRFHLMAACSLAILHRDRQGAFGLLAFLADDRDGHWRISAGERRGDSRGSGTLRFHQPPSEETPELVH